MIWQVRSPLTKNDRLKFNTVLIIDVHARDIIDSFVRDSILDEREFEWESQLRFNFRFRFFHPSLPVQNLQPLFKLELLFCTGSTGIVNRMSLWYDSVPGSSGTGTSTWD